MQPVLPVSVKGVVYNRAGDVLLALNGRGEWELPGGRIEHQETEQECLRREVLEETGLGVTVGHHLGQWVFEVLPGANVLISAYGCLLSDNQPVVLSHEHQEVRFWSPEDLPNLELPGVYREAICLWSPARSTGRDQRCRTSC